MWNSSHLSELERSGQLLFIGITGTTLTPETESFLREIRPGGILLFQRNIHSREQFQRLLQQLNRIQPIPPFLAIDQEGGRVNRLRPILSDLPTNLELSEHGDRRMVERYARCIGDCLRHLGLQINFAPVLDLSGRDSPNGVGDRSFGTDPERAAAFGESFLLSLKRSQILGTMKHFPGLGAAAVDSHQALPEIRKGRKKIWEEDLYPFRHLAPIAPIAMVSHAYYPSLSGKEPIPASLSPRIIDDLLLGTLNYQGLVLTDDLEMGSIDLREGMGKVAVRAMHAGNDMVLVCRTRRKIREAVRGLGEAMRRGSLSRDRIDRSLNKILALKRRFLRARSIDRSAQGFRRVKTEIARLRTHLQELREGHALKAARFRQGASRSVSRRKISR
ncbi:MAG: glycoside hydrolase family 3 N-terminal domain-containing protein [Acidobacteriota bacterium]